MTDYESIKEMPTVKLAIRQFEKEQDLKYRFCYSILIASGWSADQAIEYIGMNGIDTVYEFLKKEIEG